MNIRYPLYEGVYRILTLGRGRSFPFYKEYAEAALLFHRMMLKNVIKRKWGRLGNRMTEGKHFPYVDI